MASMKTWMKNLFKRDDDTKKSADEKASASSSQTAPAKTGESAPARRAYDPFAVFREDPFFQMVRSPLMTRDPGSFFGDLDSWFGDHRAAFRPTIDVTDAGSHLEVTAELPGMSEDDIKVEAQDNMLTISGEKKHESKTDEEGCYRLERSYGRFERRIPLPNDVVSDGAEARFDKGVLHVRLPKSEARKTQRQIPISS